MKLLKSIFVTDIYDDSKIMPEKNKIIIGVSSFWVLNLISHSYYNNLNILTFHLILISIFSPLFWYNYNINNIFHKLDKYIVISCFTYLWFNMNYIIFITNLLFVIPPFILSSIACVDNNYKLQLYSHQIFRFFAFKIIFIYIDTISFYYFLLIAFEYILFTLYLISFDEITYKNFYIHSFEIISIIGINEYIYYNIKNDLILL